MINWVWEMCGFLFGYWGSIIAPLGNKKARHGE